MDCRPSSSPNIYLARSAHTVPFDRNLARRGKPSCTGSVGLPIDLTDDQSVRSTSSPRITYAHRARESFPDQTVTFSRLLIFVATAALLLQPLGASAAPVTYFGEDPGGGEDTVLAATPSSDAAQAVFLAGLINPGVETFEALSGVSPLAVNFANGITATLSGNGEVTALPNGSTNGFGRYGVTNDGGDERYWESGGGENDFTITFSSPVSAFGFFGIDIGDFDGQVTATTAGGLNQVFNVGNSLNIAGGSVLFWGVIDPNASFLSVTFGNTGSGDDFFAFDDFTIGSPEQVRETPIPEPMTMTLVGGGLLAGAVRRRRARK